MAITTPIMRKYRLAKRRNCSAMACRRRRRRRKRRRKGESSQRSVREGNIRGSCRERERERERRIDFQRHSGCLAILPRRSVRSSPFTRPAIYFHPSCSIRTSTLTYHRKEGDGGVPCRGDLIVAPSKIRLTNDQHPIRLFRRLAVVLRHDSTFSFFLSCLSNVRWRQQRWMFGVCSIGRAHTQGVTTVVGQ